MVMHCKHLALDLLSGEKFSKLPWENKFFHELQPVQQIYAHGEGLHCIADHVSLCILAKWISPIF